MLQIFTDEWISQVDAKLQARMRDFNWGESIPKGSLVVAYKIQFPDDEEFTYHISCGVRESRIFPGEPGNSDTPVVMFCQSSETALGIMDGRLNTHIEFLMGNIHVSGEVLALEPYNQALAEIQACFSEVYEECEKP